MRSPSLANRPDSGRQRHSRYSTRSVLASMACAILTALFWCNVPAPTLASDKKEEDRTERTLFVPLEDLSVILGGKNERVFMTRDEYRQLEAEAEKQPETKAPIAAMLLNARYEALIRDGIAVIRGQLDVEVLDPGLQKIALPMSGVAFRTATLDDQRAPVARDAKGQVVLFAEGVGRHQLKVEFHTPVTIAAAQQSLQFQLPHAGSTSLDVVVPGNVDVKSGASVVQRAYEPEKDQTRFQLTPSRGMMALVMSLNNRRLRQDRVVVARSVLVSELTTTYERLHATIHFNVLHGAVDRFDLDVPEGFQVTSVSSPLVSQWVIRESDGREVLEVSLREPTRSTEVLSISAARAPVTIGAWRMPQLNPRDVAGHVAVIGLLAESRLRPLGLDSKELIPIDTSVLRSALPASVFIAEAGAPQIRPIAAFYAPGESFSLTATIEDPSEELNVATHLLLSLDEDRQTLRGGFTLMPLAKKKKSLSFRMPIAWQLEKLSGADQRPLPFDRYKSDAEMRYVVTLPKAIEPGQSETIYFEADFSSSAWLGEWSSTEVDFPRVYVEGATESTGAIAVQPNGDLLPKPVSTDGLTPLDSSQRSRYGLGESETELTYRVTGENYTAKFLIERVKPRMSTRNYSFFQVSDGVLVAHYEVVYVIDRAHARKLQLELPDSTPTAISIRGLDGVKLKEYSHVPQDGKNLWTILLAKAEIGSVRIAVDFEQPLSDVEPKDLALPIVRATDVAYQTQMVAVEGDPVLDIALETSMRRIDVGELAEADYAPGPRLLGAYASTADTATLQVDIARRDLRPLPAAIVKRAPVGYVDIVNGCEPIGRSVPASDESAVSGNPLSRWEGTLVGYAQRKTDQTAPAGQPDFVEFADGRGRTGC